MKDLLLGPLTFVLDVAPTNRVWGIVLTIILVLCIAAYPLKPRIWTAIITGLGILGWMLLGLIGGGINA